MSSSIDNNNINNNVNKYALTYTALFESWGHNTTVAAIIPKISALLSLSGSIYVIQDILRNPNKRNRSTFHRIMLGLSTIDMLSSTFVYFLSTWPMPVGYMTFASARSLYICDCVGFIYALTIFATPLYSCSLSTYFFIQLKLGWVDRRIKAVEKWFHIVPWAVGLIVAVGCAAAKMFGPHAYYCGVTYSYPVLCDSPDLFPGIGECQRGRGRRSYIAFFNTVSAVSILSIVYVIVTMSIVYRWVSRIETEAVKYSFTFRRSFSFRRSNTDSTRSSTRSSKGNVNRSKSRRVALQGVLYSAILLFVLFFQILNYLVFLRTKQSLYAAELLSDIFAPSQGFFNSLVYLIPVFQKMIKRRQQKKENDNRESLFSTAFSSLSWKSKTLSRASMTSGSSSSRALINNMNSNDNNTDDSTNNNDNNDKEREGTRNSIVYKNGRQLLQLRSIRRELNKEEEEEVQRLDMDMDMDMNMEDAEVEKNDEEAQLQLHVVEKCELTTEKCYGNDNGSGGNDDDNHGHDGDRQEGGEVLSQSQSQSQSQSASGDESEFSSRSNRNKDVNINLTTSIDKDNSNSNLNGSDSDADSNFDDRDFIPSFKYTGLDREEERAIEDFLNQQG